MKKFVETYNCIEGFHYYPNAPEFCKYLSARHRHLFVIRCSFEVNHNNREIEINDMQKKIEDTLHNWYGTPCEFDGLSCESIANNLLLEFNSMVKCTVLEDGYGGATLTK